MVQENQSPWNLPETIKLTSTYSVAIDDAESTASAEPQEFILTEGQQSVNVVIDNRYEEPRLTITKMDKQTGEALPGATFAVKKAVDDAVVTTYTTDENGQLVIGGSSGFESEVLYYIVETGAPTGYVLPVTPEKNYFYFCNDPALIPSILENLPAGAKAINLTETYDDLSIDNQKEKITVPVMKTWQGNAWPDGVYSVVVGLYQSVDGADPVAVLDEQTRQPLTVALTKVAPYNNTAFAGLPTRDGAERNITYSIREEHVYTSQAQTEDIKNQYVQEYGQSDSGIYIVRNREATTLTVNKVWVNREGGATAEETAAQSDITFDVYRSTTKLPADIRQNGVTPEEMMQFIEEHHLTKVRDGQRDNLTFGHADRWKKTISDLEQKDDTGAPYYYYVVETVPNFGEERYYFDGEMDGTVSIRNPVAPQTSTLTVAKAKLVADPRPGADQKDFEFTLTLNKDSRPIRRYTVADGLTTDWDGKVTFTLKPEHSIDLALPVGVTATVTEAYNQEYGVKAESAGISDSTTTNDGRTFAFDVKDGTNNATLTYTNTLHVICKVVDGQGDHAYESLSSALKYIRDNPNVAYVGGVATIQMLEDYVKPDTDVFEVRADENIALTTASTSDTLGFHTDRTDDTDTAIITRGGAGDSMLKNAGALKLDNIVLDGAKDSYTVEGNGGLVNNTGALTLSADTVLRNSAVSGQGGAIYNDGTLTMPGGSITGNTAASGSAVYIRADGVMTMTGGSIAGNTGAEDGAVVIGDLTAAVNLSGNPVIYGNTNNQNAAANLYIGADSDNVVTVPVPGLEEDAHIGVTAMAGHREIGEQFANVAYEVEDKGTLSRFVNDLYGYRGKLKDGTGTNVVWDGLTLTVKKVLNPIGANPNDTFIITLTSDAIKKTNYIIDGTVDYVVTRATASRPGTIVLRGVKAGSTITVSPLPTGDFAIAETASNYTPVYVGKNTETGAAVAIDENGAFALEGSSAITVTNTRRLADVKLTKTLTDRLLGKTDAVDFNFTVKLAEADGTAVKGFTLAEGIVTDDSGEAQLTLSPSNAAEVVKNFRAPVGATMTITETENPAYRITASAVTMPKEGEGVPIADGDASENRFKFDVTDDGAAITFANERRVTDITLSKALAGKVSKVENYTFKETTTPTGYQAPAHFFKLEVTDSGAMTREISASSADPLLP